MIQYYHYRVSNGAYLKEFSRKMSIWFPTKNCSLFWKVYVLLFEMVLTPVLFYVRSNSCRFRFISENITAVSNLIAVSHRVLLQWARCFYTKNKIPKNFQSLISKLFRSFNWKFPAMAWFSDLRPPLLLDEPINLRDFQQIQSLSETLQPFLSKRP